LRSEAYATGTSVEACIQLLDRVSVNREGWFRSLFGGLDLAAGALVLGVGCGTATVRGKTEDRAGH